LAEELNMIFKPKLNALITYSPIKDKEFVKKKSGMEVVSRDEYKEKFNKTYLTPCKQLWLIPQINWDGKLLGCCVNKWGDYGNVFKDGLEKCINSEKYLNTKKMLLGIIPKDNESTPCSNCDYFNNINVDSLINILKNKKEK